MKEKHIFVLSILVLVITAFFSAGYHHIDEHIQILEFAGLKLNMTVADNLPWEYNYQMRATIQPSIVVLLFHFFNIFGINNPFTITIFLRLLSAAIAFLGMYMIYKSYNKSILDPVLQKWFLLLSFFIWFMIYNNVRFSSENWSGSIFLIAFALLNNKKFPNKFYYLYVGFLLGLSFLFRYQGGFLILGLILWYLLIKKNWGNTAFLILGIMVMIVLGIFIDRWYYGKWTLSLWNYFEQNIILDKVSDFGIKPWWFYFKDVFIRAIPPFSIVLILSFILVFIFKRKDILTWTIFPFLLIHFIIGHKEIRFLFPVIGFIPIVIITSIEIIQKKWNKLFLTNIFVRIFAKLFWVINIALLTIIVFKPANAQISLFNKIYTEYKRPAILYYLTDNPYRNIYYYKRTNLELIKINSIDNIDLVNNRKQLLITTDKAVVKDIKRHKKLIYSTFPDWILRFNFNNWVERTSRYYVYELF